MMNQEDLFRKLGAILNELNDQYDYLAKNPRSLNELELELFLANSNFLSEHIQIIRKINNSTAFKVLPEHSEVPLSAPSGIDIQPEADDSIHQVDLFKEEQTPSFEFILNQGSSSDEPENDQDQEDVIETEEVKEPEPAEEITDIDFSLKTEAQTEPESAHEEVFFEPSAIVVEQEDTTEPELPVVHAEPILIAKEEDKVPEASAVFVEDKVEEKIVKPTLNDLLANSLTQSKRQAEVAGPTIKDLKQAINLNDKLLYIKDLFNGYNLAYAEAIELINKMPDFKTADAFLQNNYAIKNNWSAKQPTVDKFYALLKRRF